MNINGARKIAIVGVSCSGKSTLAAEMAQTIGARFIDLDELHWNPDWQASSEAVFKARLTSALDTESWVCAGNYSVVQGQIFAAADTLIWLDYPFHVVLYRALSRTVSRIYQRTPCCNGNYETISKSFFSRDSILLWVLKTYKRNQRKYHPIFNSSDGHCKLRLRHPRQARILLEKLAHNKPKEALT